MNTHLSLSKVGFVLGGVFALFHAVWALLVALQVAGPFMTWILSMHMMEMPITMLPFSFLTSLGLVVMTFVVGYIVGVVFAWLWNMLHKA